MKRFLLIIMLLLAVQAGLKAQYTVGSGGDFTDLQEAFDFINGSGLDIGDIELQVITNISVSVPLVIYHSGYAASYYSSVTIFPTASGITISSNLNNPMIELNGADNVIIDGRVNRSGAADMTITNTNTGISASTFRFTETATNNIIRYCYIKGSGTGASGGIISFSTSSTGNGNDGNTIDHNLITSSTGGRPVNAIFSSGTGGSENSGNTISNNEIYNFLRNGAGSAGINLSSNTTGWTISGNSFYESASFAPSGNVTFYAIQINNTSGTGFNVEGNFIGGRSALCGGSAWTKTTGSSPFYNNPFYGINLNVGTIVASNVKGNTIKNFAWSNSSNATWTAINIEGGAVNIGTGSGNTIGDAAVSGSITVTGGAAGTIVSGISVAGTGNIECRNNTIANILNATTSSGSNTTGIYFSGGTGTNIIGENFIHHLEVSGSSSNSLIYGIRINSGASNYSNNIVSLGGNTATTIYGIYETGAANNNNNLYFNTIYISGVPNSGATPSYALYSAVNTNTRNFRNNILFNARSNSGASGSHYAIYIVSSGGSITIDYNDYFTSGAGGVLGYLAGDITTLADWKTATVQDVNSQSINPLLANAGGTSATDYLPSAALVAVTGTGVLTDYNGSTRSVTLPTMGALETGSCINPTNGGTIASSQAGCSPFNPTGFTSTLPASGHLGTLEYKWQFSITCNPADFIDIPSSNSPAYDPGDLSQTTCYKRIARVTCKADWDGAAESNVLTITVNPLPTSTITGTLTACETTTLTAVTDAASPTYVWFQDYSIIPGETSSTLVITAGGPYRVKVTEGSTSCSQISSPATVTINPLPTATITGNLTACVTTTLTANSDAATPSYMWYKDNVVISGETNLTLIVTASGAYKFKVTNGVTSCEQTSAPSTVTINPLPTASITGTLTACATTTLTTVSDAASPSYIWYKDNVVITGETASTLVVTASGAYKVKVTNGVTTCEQTSAPSTVTINPLPTASITGALTACVTTTLTAVSDAASPSYIWYKDNVVMNGETSSTLVVTSSGAYKVKVTNGVTACEQTSAPSTVTINPLPTASITGTLIACATTTLTAVSDAASPSYIWYKDNVVITGETASTLVVTASGAYKVKVRNGVTTCEQTSVPSTVTINPLPTASITGILTVCVTTTLTAVSDAASPSYIWYKDNVVMSGETSSTLVVTSSGAYKVKVTNGVTACEQTSAPSTVTINPLPTASITGTLIACATTTLTAVSDAASPSYIWYKDNVVITGETASTLVVTASGAYKVKVTNGVTTCEQTSAPSTVTINPLPTASITGTLTACVTTTLTAVSDAASPSYIWYKDNVVMSGETSSTLVVTSSGAYKVKVTNGVTACEQTSAPSTVTINPLPDSGISVGGSGTVCPGTGTNITIDLSESGVEYQLRNDSGNTNVGTPVTGTGGTLILPTGNLNSSATFNIQATNIATGCSTELNETEIVMVASTAAGGSVGGVNSSIIYGASTGILTLSGHAGNVSNWQRMEGSGTWEDITSSATTYSESPFSAATWQYRAHITIGTCSEAFSLPFSITVDPKPLIITANDQTKVYGTAFTFAGNEFTVSGLINSDAVTNVVLTSAGTSATADVPGTPYTITPSSASGTGITNYSITYANGIFTLTKAVLTFTADNKTREYNTPNPGLTYIITGFVNTETQSVLDVLPAISTIAIQSSATGTYPITVSGGSDNNYSYSYVAGILTVTKIQQVITFSALPEKMLMKDTYTLTASSTSGLTVLFESLDPEFATVSGTLLTGVSAGNARIRAYHAGDLNYDPAETTGTVEIYSTHKNILYLFTPNNDGINDKWELPELATWGKCYVKVYSRWGQLVFSEKDYNNLWDGTSNGDPLPEGPYYFIIDTENEGVVKGTVNIVR